MFGLSKGIFKYIFRIFIFVQKDRFIDCKHAYYLNEFIDSFSTEINHKYMTILIS